MKSTHAKAWQEAFDRAASLESVRIYPNGAAFIELEGNEEPVPPGPCEYHPVELPGGLIAINKALDAAGWVPMSEWWSKRLARFYYGNWIAREMLRDAKRQRRRCIWRVGRRGGKSTSICRVAVHECIYGEHDVPPGDTGVYPIISAERPQTKDRLTTIKAICDVLGVEGKPYAEAFEFGGIRRAIRCFTASITSVVSFTAIGGMCDEEAIWRDTDTGANPAEAVIKALTPTIATMRNAVIHHVSAPWAEEDEHYKMFEQGNTAAQLAFEAPTWVANDGFISEEETHILEPDEPSHARAYGAIPMKSDAAKFFNGTLIEQARNLGEHIT